MPGERHDDGAGPQRALERLQRCYSDGGVVWDLCFSPRWERGNFASRYHLVYPALAFWILIRAEPARAAAFKPLLDTMYQGLLQPRCWAYWHTELEETTAPLKERNLTYAGRLASFIGFYIDAFGHPPAEEIRLDGEVTTYSELSRNLWMQMKASPSCGVSCYHRTSMVMCNAHLLINNLLHDRLFGTCFADANAAWLATVEQRLLTRDASGSLFYYGTLPDSADPHEPDRSDGMDIWSLFLMSAVVPATTRDWFETWKSRIVSDPTGARIEIPLRQTKGELSSTPLATAWAFCLARELGDSDLAASLGRTLESQVEAGFVLDPLLSGLYLLGESLEPGGFRRLVAAPPR